MAKQFIKRFLPHPHQLQNHKVLKLFGTLLTNPNLWHLNRYSVATAVSIGLFVAYIPFVGHMLIAALFAIWLRANLAIAVLLVWIVNPFTMVPMFGFAYFVGAKILGMSMTDVHFHSWGICKEIWEPLLLGSLVCGGVLAIIGNFSVRIFWRIQIAKAWKLRQLQRR